MPWTQSTIDFGGANKGGGNYVQNMVRTGALQPYSLGHKTVYAQPGLSPTQVQKASKWVQSNALTQAWPGTPWQYTYTYVPASTSSPSLLSSLNLGGASGNSGITGGGTADVTSGINVSPLIDPAQTARSQSRLLAESVIDPSYAMKQYTHPGVSSSAGTLSAGLGDVARSRAAGLAAAQQQLLADRAANAEFQLAAEQARESDAISQAALLQQLLSTQQQSDMARRRMMIDALDYAYV